MITVGAERRWSSVEGSVLRVLLALAPRRALGLDAVRGVFTFCEEAAKVENAVLIVRNRASTDVPQAREEFGDTWGVFIAAPRAPPSQAVDVEVVRPVRGTADILV